MKKDKKNILFPKGKFIFIAGPCVIESKKSAGYIAGKLKNITKKYPVRFIFKASFDKANRTSIKSFRGPGLSRGMDILRGIKKKEGVFVMTDVHCVAQAKPAARVVDVIQIPAFLSRQTDLVLAAANTGRYVNIKKAQFMSPYDIKYVIEKAESCGNKKVMITERGTAFGYNNLVVDFRSILIMKDFGYPVIYDATHSLQRPSGQNGVSGGDREFVFALSLAAVAAGADGIFLETHPAPEKACSDKATSLHLDKVEDLLKNVLAVREAVYGKNK